MITTKSTGNSTMNESNKFSTTAVRVSHLLARRQRIEGWASKGRSASINATVSAATALLGTVSAQRRSESSYSQASRKLHAQLLQLSEQRQQTIERRAFDQKMFANKQALKHKDNPAVLQTLSYVRKCCKYTDVDDDDNDEIKSESTKLSDGKSTVKRSHSQLSSPVKRTLSANPSRSSSVKHNKTFLESCNSSFASEKLIEVATSSLVMSSGIQIDDNSSKRHVQFRIHPDGSHLTSQSAHLMSKSHSSGANKNPRRTINSAPGIRSSNSLSYHRSVNSAPPLSSLSPSITPANIHVRQSYPPRRSLSRLSASKPSLHEFRLHPEKYLSASNCYLPLLRRHTIDNETKERNDLTRRSQSHFSPSLSRLSVGSDLAFDDAKSFLSEDNETGKYASRLPSSSSANRHGRNNKSRVPTKIDMMDTFVDDNSSHTIAMARLRDREYARLNQLIQSNIIDKVIEPLSAIKTDDDEQIDLKGQKILKYKRQYLPTSIRPPPIKPNRARQLGDILRSIDSLSCSDAIDRRARKEIDMEKNRAKLGILIF